MSVIKGFCRVLSGLSEGLFHHWVPKAAISGMQVIVVCEHGRCVVDFGIPGYQHS